MFLQVFSVVAATVPVSSANAVVLKFNTRFRRHSLTKDGHIRVQDPLFAIHRLWLSEIQGLEQQWLQNSAGEKCEQEGKQGR